MEDNNLLKLLHRENDEDFSEILKLYPDIDWDWYYVSANPRQRSCPEFPWNSVSLGI